MIKINRKVEYALIVLQHLQKQAGEVYVTARAICDLYQTPFDTTSRVMQIMNQHNILQSQQGTKGGYKLASDLRKINYLELVEIIEGKKIKQDCEQQQCSLISSCNISGPITKLNQYLVYYFQGLSLKELLEDAPNPVSYIREGRI